MILLPELHGLGHRHMQRHDTVCMQLGGCIIELWVKPLIDLSSAGDYVKFKDSRGSDQRVPCAVSCSASLRYKSKSWKDLELLSDSSSSLHRLIPALPSFDHSPLIATISLTSSLKALHSHSRAASWCFSPSSVPLSRQHEHL